MVRLTFTEMVKWDKIKKTITEKRELLGNITDESKENTINNWVDNQQKILDRMRFEQRMIISKRQCEAEKRHDLEDWINRHQAVINYYQPEIDNFKRVTIPKPKPKPKKIKRVKKTFITISLTSDFCDNDSNEGELDESPFKPIMLHSSSTEQIFI